MKPILLALAIAVSLSINAQTDALMYGVLPVEAGRVTYTQIIDIEGATKDRLFTLIKEWAVDAYKSQKTTLETEDREAGFIAYKGYFVAVGILTRGMFKGKPYRNKVYHTLKFFVKDGKVKVQVTDLATEGIAEQIVAGRGQPTPTPVESYDDGLNRRQRNGNVSAKKSDKLESDIEANAEVLGQQVQAYVNSISGHLKKNKSQFDF